MTKKSKYILISILSLVILGFIIITCFYIWAANGFVEAIKNTTIGIEDAKKDWKKRDVYPIDSIKNEVLHLLNDNKELDSIAPPGP